MSSDKNEDEMEPDGSKTKKKPDRSETLNRSETPDRSETQDRSNTLVGILLGFVVLSGLGYLAKQGNDLNRRVGIIESAQIEELRKRITKIEKDVEHSGNISARLNNLSEHVSTLKIDVAVLKAFPKHVDDLRKRVTMTEEAIETLKTTGHIVAPKENDVVPTVFAYEIELSNPAETKHYYLVNRIGGSYWPKVHIKLQPDQIRYTGSTEEGGTPPNGRFSIILFEVDVNMHREITKWLNGTDFSGIQIEGRELDSLNLVLRR